MLNGALADVNATTEAIAFEVFAFVSEICEFLEVNRTAFYAWRDSEPTVFEELDAELTPVSRIIFKKHRRRYGA